MSFDQLPEDLILGGREERLRRALMQQLRGGAALAPTAAPPMAAAPKPQAISNPPPLTNATQGMSGRTATSATADNGIDARMTDIEGQLEKFRQPTDYSGLEKYAGERKESGNNALMLALAAQAAGDPAKPILEVMLKRSLAAQNPEKYLAGNVTDQGFVEDPDYGRQNTRNSLEAQLTRLATQKSTNESRMEAAAMRRTITGMQPRMVTDSATGKRYWVAPGMEPIEIGGVSGPISSGNAKLMDEAADSDSAGKMLDTAIGVMRGMSPSEGGYGVGIRQGVPLVGSSLSNLGQSESFKNARTLIENAYAKPIHDLYGAALTGNELMNAQQWKPSASDEVSEMLRKVTNYRWYLGLGSALMQARAMNNGLKLAPEQEAAIRAQYTATNGGEPAVATGAGSNRSSRLRRVQ